MTKRTYIAPDGDRYRIVDRGPIELGDLKRMLAGWPDDALVVVSETNPNVLHLVDETGAVLLTADNIIGVIDLRSYGEEKVDD